MLTSVRLPLFVVEIAYADGIQELATSSKIASVDPSELVVFHPSENEFHTRLEVSSSIDMSSWQHNADLSNRENSVSSAEGQRHHVTSSWYDFHVSRAVLMISVAVTLCSPGNAIRWTDSSGKPSTPFERTQLQSIREPHCG